MKRLLVVNPVDAPEYHERWAVWQDLAEATRRQLPSVELAVGGRDAFLGAQGLHAVHLNFLESVVGAEGPTERNMAVLAARFEELRRTGVRVILTRHDIANLWGTPGYERLYRLAYTAADVVVHLGRHSVEDFQRRRDDVHAGAHASHVVIPQPVPSRLTPADRAAARSALGIAADRVVVLVFGTIRSSREMAFALRAFRRLSCPGKLLVTTRARFPGAAWATSSCARSTACGAIRGSGTSWCPSGTCPSTLARPTWSCCSGSRSRASTRRCWCSGWRWATWWSAPATA